VTRDGHVWLVTVGLCVAVSSPAHCDEPPRCVAVAEDFEGGDLNPERWQFTSAHGRASRHQVVRRDRNGSVNHELRLAADISGTSSGAVGFVGVVHPRPLDLRRRQDIEVEIDVSEPGHTNGLRAGVYLAPVLTWEPPERGSDWFKFEYVDEAMGTGVQGVLAARRGGRLTIVGTPARPAPPRPNRGMSRRAVRIRLEGRRVRVFEDGALWQESADLELPFSSAYLYLQMSARGPDQRGEVFFDDLVVRTPCRHASSLDQPR
jgi:hypothetical protein